MLGRFLGLGLLLLGTTGFIGQEKPYLYKAEGVMPSLLQSSETIEVTQSATAWSFKSKKNARKTTLVFCPGGLVEPTAYAPLVRSVAEKGYPVFLIKLGPQYESLEIQKQDGVDKIKSIVDAGGKTKFVIAGHSLGGAISALYAQQKPTLLNGLLICGSTHPRDFDLSALKVPVTKVYASNDGIARKEHTENNKPKLPSHTKWVLIQGGNHSQFGNYTKQPGDPDATISREKQQEAVLKEMEELLAAVDKG